VESATRFDALAMLHAQGLTVVALKGGEAADLLTTPAEKHGATSAWLSSRQVRLSDRAVFCRQMAVSVGAGITLRESLESDRP